MPADCLTIPVDPDLPVRLHVALWREEPTEDERAYLAACLDSYCVREVRSPLGHPNPWDDVLTPQVRTTERVFAAIVSDDECPCEFLPGSAVGAWLRERDERDRHQWDAYFTRDRREARLAARAGDPMHGAASPGPRALPAQPAAAPGVRT